MNADNNFVMTTLDGGSFNVPAPARRERNYNMEDPTYPLDDPTVWSDGIEATSGQRVNPTKLLNLPAALQAVDRISGDVARCPLEIYREDNGTYKPLYDDPLYRLTAIQPNREMDFFTFWQRVMTFRLIWRNSYIFIAPLPSGEPGELLPLLPDRTKAKRAGGVLYYETEVNGQKEQIPASRIMHLQGIGFDNLEALPLCKLMKNALGLALSQFDFVSKVYRGGGRRGGVLEIPTAMTKGSADKLEEGFRRKYEDNGQWFTTIVLRDNAKFHDAQMTLRESQALEGREESVRDIARAFNIRPGHLGVETSGVYGNKSDDTRDYLDMTLRPHMTAIAAQARIKLLPLPRQAGHCFGHNTDELLQMSVKEEFEAYGTGVEKTVITSNEARGKLGFAPHKDGDELRSPHTQSSKDPGDGGRGTGNKPKPPATRPDPGDDENDDAFNQLDAALEAAVEKHLGDVVRVIGGKAERAAASGAKFIAWLDEKFPAERDALSRAIAPVAACLAIHRGGPGQPIGSLTVVPPAATAAFERLAADLHAIANEKSEAELRPAVIDYFTNWSNPCPQPKKQAA